MAEATASCPMLTKFLVFHTQNLARAWEIWLLYILMPDKMSPVAAGITVQQVEPTLSEPTDNCPNSIGGYPSTLGGTTAQVLPLNRC